MKRIALLGFVFALLASLNGVASEKYPTPPGPALAAPRIMSNGQQIQDSYPGLLGENTPAITAWDAAQTKLTQTTLATLAARPQIRARLEGIRQLGSTSAPTPAGPYRFRLERGADDPYAIITVEENGVKRVLVDPSKNGRAGRLVKFYPNSDGSLLAYSINPEGKKFDQYELVVVETATAKETDLIPVERQAYEGQLTWLPDGIGFVYIGHVTHSENYSLNMDVMRHNLGTQWQDDTLFLAAGSPESSHDLLSFSGGNNWFVVGLDYYPNGEHANLLQLYEWQKPSAKPRTVWGGDAKVKTVWDMQVSGDQVYVLTKHQAPWGKVMVASINDLAEGKTDWKVAVPEEEGRAIEKIVLSDKYLVIRGTRPVRGVVEVFDRATGQKVFIYDTKDHLLGIIDSAAVDEVRNVLVMEARSFAVKSRIVEVSLTDFSLKTVSEIVPPGTNPDEFKIEQTEYPSEGGVMVPISLVYRKDLVKNGNTPTLVWVYGGHGVSMPPTFRDRLFPFFDNGGIVAIVHVRGGGEKGEEWYKAGRGRNKINSPLDLAYAASWLVAQGYTQHEKIGVMGESSGGLTTASAGALFPHSFGAVVTHAGLDDLPRLMDTKGGFEWKLDYGAPDDPVDLTYMLRVSPIQRLTRASARLKWLVTAGDIDDRVDPSNSRRFVARLQELNAMAYLRMEPGAGHFGASNVRVRLEEDADKLAFLFWAAGFQWPKEENTKGGSPATSVAVPVP
ncbi:MAG: hypothetical protein A3A33_04335 [Candidatus Yanofskybacteria bacterium RIFCSPLOWO2_01_FULL_49_25]|uniref:prolyl oligopeptidase n=1 Tax=Candidatus Yanofskybacteria bacterium RIFCSPLOWO2_01_FULL_49_25 TaxID=1802701 RepID=A0A1F8GWA5_9BACT|nr:MAG: hypothetical protein A3A33_04335 [Candidatus Yanofskybacteria bacterium RIFCSPLOWO2_01_FULL_49_25]